MPRDAVSRTANVERNGGHKWVKYEQQFSPKDGCELQQKDYGPFRAIPSLSEGRVPPEVTHCDVVRMGKFFGFRVLAFIILISMLWIFNLKVFFSKNLLISFMFFSIFTSLRFRLIPSLRVREVDIKFFLNFFASSMFFLLSYNQRGFFKFHPHFRISMSKNKNSN